MHRKSPKQEISFKTNQCYLSNSATAQVFHMSTNVIVRQDVKGAQIIVPHQVITPQHKTKEKKSKQTDLTTDYTLCDVNTKDTIRYNIAPMTYASRVYIPYPLGTLIK